MKTRLTQNILLAFSLCLFVSFNLFAGESIGRLTVQQAQQEIDLIEEVYERIHPGYTRYAAESEMRAAWQQLREQIDTQQGINVNDFYLAIQRVLVRIRCDHTKANIPTALLEQRKTTGVFLPFRWHWVEQRGFITQVSASATEQLNIGDEILTIDGRPLTDLVEEVIQYIPYDGNTEWARNAGVAQSLEFNGGAVDHFGSMLWQNKPEVTLRVRDTDANVRLLTVARINYDEYRAIPIVAAGARNFKDAIRFEIVDANTAYLAVDTFVNYRQPVDPEEVYAPIFAQIKQAGIKKLIVDLRKNGGGSNDASQGLMRFLLTEEKALYNDMYMKTLDMDGIRPYLSSWDERVLDPYRIAFSKRDEQHYSLRAFLTDDLDTVKPHELAFDGQLIALTSESNSSGSAMLLTHLSEQDNATLIGQKTGGSSTGPTAGVLITLTLPHSNITARVPVFRYQINAADHGFGLGVNPDIEVAATAEDWMANIDASMAAALAR